MKTKISILGIVLLLCALVIISCKKDRFNQVANDSHSSTPQLPETPYNYPVSSNDQVAALGRVLFYDKSLSLNNSVACASCHQQEKAFCDNLKVSTGLEDVRTQRNSPSLFAKNGRMFWDGRAENLEDLVLKPVQNHVEMKFEDLHALASKISKIGYYPELFEKAFGSPSVSERSIQLALSEFLRNFNFANNKFVRSRRGQESLNASERLGENLFFGKAKCSTCHDIEPNRFAIFDSSFTGTGYGFTDEDFNIGLDMVYADNGKGDVTGDPTDKGKFMVPVLLNVEYTAPYMHDGRFKTLEEVVEHYNSGIKNHQNLDVMLRDIDKFATMTEAQALAIVDQNKNGEFDEEEIALIPPRKLNLSTTEKRNLVDFLKTLSDPSILKDIKFSDPFVSKR